MRLRLPARLGAHWGHPLIFHQSGGTPVAAAAVLSQQWRTTTTTTTTNVTSGRAGHHHHQPHPHPHGPLPGATKGRTASSSSSTPSQPQQKGSSGSAVSNSKKKQKKNDPQRLLSGAVSVAVAANDAPAALNAIAAAMTQEGVLPGEKTVSATLYLCEKNNLVQDGIGLFNVMVWNHQQRAAGSGGPPMSESFLFGERVLGMVLRLYSRSGDMASAVPVFRYLLSHQNAARRNFSTVLHLCGELGDLASAFEVYDIATKSTTTKPSSSSSSDAVVTPCTSSDGEATKSGGGETFELTEEDYGLLIGLLTPKKSSSAGQGTSASHHQEDEQEGHTLEVPFIAHTALLGLNTSDTTTAAADGSSKVPLTATEACRRLELLLSDMKEHIPIPDGTDTNINTTATSTTSSSDHHPSTPPPPPPTTECSSAGGAGSRKGVKLVDALETFVSRWSAVMSLEKKNGLSSPNPAANKKKEEEGGVVGLLLSLGTPTITSATAATTTYTANPSSLKGESGSLHQQDLASSSAASPPPGAIQTLDDQLALCWCCQSQLQGYPFTTAYRNQLLSDIDTKLVHGTSGRGIRTQKAKLGFQTFRKFIESPLAAKVNCIIDGANLGYYGLSSWYHLAKKDLMLRRGADRIDEKAFAAKKGEFDMSQRRGRSVDVPLSFNVIDLALKEAKQQLKLNPIILLHERHVEKWNLTTENEAILTRWTQDRVVFTTPSGLNDDFCWLYGGVHHTTPSDATPTISKRVKPATNMFIVSNDKMRDHHFGLLSRRSFTRWRDQHTINFRGEFKEGKTHIFLKPPPSFSVCMQHQITTSHNSDIIMAAGGAGVEESKGQPSTGLHQCSAWHIPYDPPPPPPLPQQQQVSVPTTTTADVKSSATPPSDVTETAGGSAEGVEATGLESVLESSAEPKVQAWACLRILRC